MFGFDWLGEAHKFDVTVFNLTGKNRSGFDAFWKKKADTILHSYILRKKDAAEAARIFVQEYLETNLDANEIEKGN